MQFNYSNKDTDDLIVIILLSVYSRSHSDPPQKEREGYRYFLNPLHVNCILLDRTGFVSRNVHIPIYS
jgi:hypothetical protein